MTFELVEDSQKIHANIIFGFRTHNLIDRAKSEKMDTKNQICETS
jgi:hypothetical protein